MSDEQSTDTANDTGSAHGWPCPYRPGLVMSTIDGIMPPIDATAYRQLLDHNCRRAGRFVYRPNCPNCTSCQQLRVPVARFQPRRDQRRCLTRNADLTVSTAEPMVTDELQDLFERYQARVHDDAEGSDTLPSLLDGPMPMAVLVARDAEQRLLAVSVLDVFADALSSVYCVYDPDQPRRSLGTFMALAEIDHARAIGKDWVYFGFYIAECSQMAYKARYAPHQILDPHGEWHESEYPPEQRSEQQHG